MGVEQRVEEDSIAINTERKLKSLDENFHRDLSAMLTDDIGKRRYPIYFGRSFEPMDKAELASVRDFEILGKTKEKIFRYKGRDSRFEEVSGKGVYLVDLNISIGYDFVEDIHDFNFLRNLNPSEEVFQHDKLPLFTKHLKSKNNRLKIEPFINAYVQARDDAYTNAGNL